MIIITFRETNGKVSKINCKDRYELYLKMKMIRANGCKVFGVRDLDKEKKIVPVVEVKKEIEDPQLYLWGK